MHGQMTMASAGFEPDAAGAFPPATAVGWTGFGRCLTDDGGRYRFVTVVPGEVDELEQAEATRDAYLALLDGLGDAGFLGRRSPGRQSLRE